MSADEDNQCGMCPVTGVDLRPVMVVDCDDAVLTCPTCYRLLEESGRIDEKADQEQFGYGPHGVSS